MMNSDSDSDSDTLVAFGYLMLRSCSKFLVNAMKRSSSSSCPNPIKIPKMQMGSGHWSQGLLSSMNDPNLKVKSDNLTVVIRDKYPKARYHYLVLPKENIANLQSLKIEHASLLKHMEEVGKSLTSQHKDHEFRLGYHSIPSMSQIHLHVISQDFNSPCLKTKKHWNSFTTKYFINSEEIMAELEKNGCVQGVSPDVGKHLLNSPLKCHKCSYISPNMPKLKLHIQQHEETA